MLLFVIIDQKRSVKRAPVPVVLLLVHNKIYSFFLDFLKAVFDQKVRISMHAVYFNEYPSFTVLLCIILNLNHAIFYFILNFAVLVIYPHTLGRVTTFSEKTNFLATKKRVMFRIDVYKLRIRTPYTVP